MSATAAPVASDRSDFRTVTVGGAKLGVATAVAVVAFLAASRLVPITAGLRGAVEALIVVGTGLAGAFPPARWTTPRSTEALAGVGGIVTARQAMVGGRAVQAAVLGPLVLVIVARLAGLGFALPLEAGVAYTVVLALLALVTLARKG